MIPKPLKIVAFMELDLAHYSKDLIVEDSADEISAVLLNEVNRGGTEKLHKFDYKPRYQNFDKTLLLNLDNFRFLNSRKFEDGDIFVNTIKAHPKVSLFGYNGKIYINNFENLEAGILLLPVAKVIGIPSLCTLLNIFEISLLTFPLVKIVPSRSVTNIGEFVNV